MPVFQFRATQPAEAGRVREFLAEVFQTGLGAPSLDPRLIHWKYYEPRPDWPGGRSYVFEREGQYVAHGCVWPMQPGGVQGCQIIDWAGARNVPGAGLLLRREIEKLVNVSVAIGGSEDSRNVLPRAGYKTVAQFRKFARVLRPFRQFRQRQAGNFGRNAAKAVRNFLWSRARLPAIAPESSAESVERFNERDLPEDSPRSAGLLNYFLRCPAVPVRGYRFLHGRVPAGFFLLSEVEGQARLADIYTADDWRTAVTLAVRAAADCKTACELVANSCFEPLSTALLESGFQARGEQPVYVRDPQGALGGRPFHITPADYDDYFGIYPGYTFVT